MLTKIVPYTLVCKALEVKRYNYLGNRPVSPTIIVFLHGRMRGYRIKSEPCHKNQSIRDALYIAKSKLKVKM